MRVESICCRQDGPTLVAGKGRAAITRPSGDGRKKSRMAGGVTAGRTVLWESTFAIGCPAAPCCPGTVAF